MPYLWLCPLLVRERQHLGPRLLRRVDDRNALAAQLNPPPHRHRDDNGQGGRSSSCSRCLTQPPTQDDEPTPDLWTYPPLLELLPEPHGQRLVLGVV